ncbi:thiolase family protein [Mycolicibacterium elephantis]|uniref:Acetyl-CoA acetyltransferase n=1 Tax=Mycolicibacterium elephantis DSM 44368 TaxID=1335622 RepID=A0A439DQU0_9MYCO|nr:thiolase family protein [Mycolicibacterium elephantis]MCV7219623.1 thiolase family protein [Mycolicibacterium elephantis]RWA18140.1 acetyl-CoA acetyltransferase [Mycolicibacterium elephantis DSM 44368]
MSHFEKDAVISGLGLSRVGRRTGIPGLELTLEAARAAIDDAGLATSDIDGIASLGDVPLAEVTTALGIDVPDRTSGFDTGGLLTPVMSACRAVAEKRARHVLVYRTVLMLGGTMTESPSSSGPNPLANPASEPHTPGTRRRLKPFEDIDELLAAHAYSAANWLAMHCRRHMELYGTTKEQLGWLAINSRRNAALNPRAAYREPMTMDDYLAARPVSTPFGLFDCDVPVDGSIAVVVSHADYAADCPNPAVAVEAIGGSYGSGGWFHRDDFPKMASVDAAAQMWSRTDLTASDVDVAELYDGFTFLTIAWLEALGFCADGEGGPFVEGATRIALDGALPLNTYGGQLSAGRMHGYWLLHEACLQLRGQAGERQLTRRPEVAVAAAGGGPIAGCMLLTC